MNLERTLMDFIAAQVCDFITGATGGTIDLTDWTRHLEATATTPPPPRPPARFEAYTDCPKCQRLDVHWLRAPCTDPVPDRPDPPTGVALWSQLYANTALAPVDLAPPPMKPNPEAAFDVIRICRSCGHEWGQL